MLVRLRSQATTVTINSNFRGAATIPSRLAPPLWVATATNHRPTNEKKKIQDNHRAADRASNAAAGETVASSATLSIAVITAVTPCMPAIVGTFHVMRSKSLTKDAGLDYQPIEPEGDAAQQPDQGPDRTGVKMGVDVIARH